jgi:hypothetical protein
MSMKSLLKSASILPMLDATEPRIGAITRFHTNHLLPYFGLPETVE